MKQKFPERKYAGTRRIREKVSAAPLIEDAEERMNCRQQT
jgi:hypothetical protein